MRPLWEHILSDKILSNFLTDKKKAQSKGPEVRPLFHDVPAIRELGQTIQELNSEAPVASWESLASVF